MQRFHVQDQADVNQSFRAGDLPGHRVDQSDYFINILKPVFIDQVSFIYKQEIGKGDLLIAFIIVIEVFIYIYRIDKSDDAVNKKFIIDERIKVKDFRDRSGIGNAGSFDHQVFKLPAAFNKVNNYFSEITFNGAAQAAVCQLKNRVFIFDDQISVNANFAEFIDDHSNLAAVFFGQDVIQQSSFAGTQKSGENSNRNFPFL